jgi:hypothetical protein
MKALRRVRPCVLVTCFGRLVTREFFVQKTCEKVVKLDLLRANERPIFGQTHERRL